MTKATAAQRIVDEAVPRPSLDGEANGGDAVARKANPKRPPKDRPRKGSGSRDSRRVGRVVAVSGSQVVALLDPRKPDAAGESQTRLQIGMLVTMQTPASTVFAVVSGLSLSVPEPDNPDRENRVAEIELVGEVCGNGQASAGRFRRGVTMAPSLGDVVHASTHEDLVAVYRPPDAATISIGSLHQDPSVPAHVIIDDLLGKHFAVLGTTGCGKSCTVALILRRLLERHHYGHIIMLDPHNEYAHAFGDSADVLGPETFRLPYWLLNFEELTEVVLGDKSDTHEAEAAIFKDAIIAAKQSRQRDGADGENNGAQMAGMVDSPVPFLLTDVFKFLNDEMGKLERAESLTPYLRIKARIDALKSDSRYGFLFPGLMVRDNMAAILAQMFSIPVNDKPITIVDLSSVPSEILNVVVSVLCRLAFDFAVLADGKVPIMFVCEEAHRYAPQNPRLGFEPTKRALARIAKEGRKHGLSLCVVSQRPSELAEGILSQCNTVFALRMSNQADQDYVRATLSEFAVGFVDALSTLRNSEAIVVGEGVPLSMRVFFDELPPDERPKSGTASFSSSWEEEGYGESFLADLVERWRGRH